ncbi:mechanosensitive ion channel protein MscS [Corynebacterium phocae]|uniref:Mechanosensitive ion channel protein MscS n=1 Tax=Corynebacterium phocae TaxID=161895 RepID=A0A1L7D1N8_9CORY|nr:mechanosensitive ion channel family protein [Corynebacterium phocae]APT92049.1 mechanosensitive ion channel protein MscS [Corynebacterium phocae]KAA8726433.1 mechanosensitive ion channel family protein [Corynebacterium phocae]
MTTTNNEIPNPQEAVNHVNNWWQSDWTQTWLIERPISIALIVLIALIAHWLLRRIIRKAAAKASRADGIRRSLTKPLKPSSAERPARDYSAEVALQAKARESRRVARIQTLASVASSASAIFVWAWALVAILSQLDVNVAPLIASAGVVGVALGFGAQSLVKDFLSGIFMLIEDQYGIGDVVDLGNGVFGDVEDITLRITTVRDIDGALWYVRNGEILKVANHSNDFAIARLQIPLSLSNDADKAEAFLHDSVTSAIQHDEVRGLILDDPKFQGISVFETDHASFRVSIKTLPGRQWDVQRFVHGFVWNDMKDKGISAPYPKGIGIKSDER